MEISFKCPSRSIKTLHLHDLHAKPSKCQLDFSSIEYLGHQLSQNSIEPIEDRSISISKLPLPKKL